MADRIVYVITDGTKFKCFSEGLQSEVIFGDHNMVGNPYLIFGKFCQQWLDHDYNHLAFVVSEVVSGNI